MDGKRKIMHPEYALVLIKSDFIPSLDYSVVFLGESGVGNVGVVTLTTTFMGITHAAASERKQLEEKPHITHSTTGVLNMPFKCTCNGSLLLTDLSDSHLSQRANCIHQNVGGTSIGEWAADMVETICLPANSLVRPNGIACQCIRATRISSADCDTLTSEHAYPFPANGRHK